ncbi:MAG: hypothetical protein F6J95_018870 [Leptolyngbya sp. SIO1E4]|nr:hypothetical protein [Leptolyngbya sp. SIO1E4]
MSEANVPPRPPSSNELDALARTGQVPAEQPSPAALNNRDWETVPLPGMLPVDSIPAPSPGNPSSEGATSPRHSDLLVLIKDLNRCNEVLLSRVNQLEEALETSQRALQQEVERSQQLTEEDKVAVAQQQSVAQLLSELEQANAELKRQTILSETLQVQLTTFQERSQRLEHECALLQKRHAEKTQKLQAAEETCRDFKSRLQRQQHYTLQFKAALEKCLGTSACHQTTAGSHPESESESPPTFDVAAALNPLAMPRSERIQPWSATETAAQADPQLLSLVRSLNEPEQPAPTSPPAPPMSAEPPLVTPEPKIEGEAEKQLWQDVERVIESSTDLASPGAQETVATPPENTATDEVQFTEPMPWGAPIQKVHEVAANTQANDLPTPPLSGEATPPAGASEPATESPTAAKSLIDMPPGRNRSSLTTEIPALDAAQAAQASPSPIVHPLRPTQRKRKSLSAVELPSFPPLPKQPDQAQ